MYPQHLHVSQAWEPSHCSGQALDDSAFGDVRARISAGVQSFGSRLARRDSLSLDSSSGSGRRTVAERLAERLQEIRRTLLDQPRSQPSHQVRDVLFVRSVLCVPYL